MKKIPYEIWLTGSISRLVYGNSDFDFELLQHYDKLY